MSSNRCHRAGQCAPEVPRTRISARGDLQEHRTRPGLALSPIGYLRPGQATSLIQHQTPASLARALQRRAIGNMLLAGALQRRVCVEEVAAPRKPMRHQRKSLLLPLRRTAWHHREAHASKEKHCWQGEAMRAGRSSAGREKQCEQGEAVRATCR